MSAAALLGRQFPPDFLGAWRFAYSPAVMSRNLQTAPHVELPLGQNRIAANTRVFSPVHTPGSFIAQYKLYLRMYVAKTGFTHFSDISYIILILLVYFAISSDTLLLAEKLCIVIGHNV